jgi:drug/metabolite transporter (DMT)-like permease
MLRSMAKGDARGDEPTPTTLAAFVLAVVLAGGNAVAIRYSSCGDCELGPFWGAAIRFLLAAAVFAAVASVVRASVPTGRAVVGSVLFGALQFGGAFGFAYWGLVRTPAGLAQVLLASVPLLTFGLALVHRLERFRWQGLIGATLAVGGIAVVFRSGVHTGVPVSAMLAILAGAVCFAEALIVIKVFPPVHPAALNAIGMGVGGVILLALTALFHEDFVLAREAQTLFAQAYLIVAGSVVVFWLYVVVAKRWTASAASYQLVLIPLVTVLVSAWLQDEQITWAFAVGAVLVLVGAYYGALRRPTAPAVSPPRTEAAERT